MSPARPDSGMSSVRAKRWHDDDREGGQREAYWSGDGLVLGGNLWAAGPVPFINVTHPRFGAKGDGVTDDSAAIQAAINTVPTQGAVIYLPPSPTAYLVSGQGLINNDSLAITYALKVPATAGPVFIHGPGVKLKLAGAQTSKTVILAIAGASTGYRTASTIVDGLEFDGNVANNPNFADFGMITAVYANDVEIRNCYFHDWPFDAVHILRDCQHAKVRNCRFDSLAATHTALRGETNGLIIEGNTFITDAVSGVTHISLGDNADILMQAHGMQILHNEFHGGPASPQIDVGGVTHARIAGNVFRDQCNNAGSCIKLEIYTNANGTIFDTTDCLVEDNIMMNVRQGVLIVGSNGSMVINSTTYYWYAGAFRNAIKNNIITKQVDLTKAQLGGATSYPAVFPQAPNAVTVNLAIGVQESCAAIDSGTASAGGAATLTDATKSATWVASKWIGATLRITGGTGVGQERTISANTTTVLTVSSAWTTQPDNTSTYEITDPTGNNLIAGNRILGIGTTKGVNILSKSYKTVVQDNSIEGSNAGNFIVPGNATVRRNAGYLTEARGVASVANAGTIAHGLAAAPTKYGLTSTVAKHIASVTGVDATNLTIALYDDAGAAVAVAENVAWWAEV